jgi:predicted ester cyclase
MDSEEVKANEKRFFDFFNKRDIDAIEKWIDESVAQDFVNHSPVLNEPTDRQGLKEMVRTLFQMAPEMTIRIEEMVFENNVLCFRNILRGVDTQDEMMGMVMVKFKDGKVSERWSLNEAH